MKIPESSASIATGVATIPGADSQGTPFPYRTLILGAGRLGTALAAQMQQRQLPLLGLWNRRPLSSAASIVPDVVGELPVSLCKQADLLLLTVSDEAIVGLAQSLLQQGCLHPHQILLHCSGRLASDQLDFLETSGHHVGRMHPLQPIATSTLRTRLFSDIAVGVEGSPFALEAATTLAQILGGRTFSLTGVDSALYHAAAVIASNYVVCLAYAAQQLMKTAGLSEPALPLLLPLMEQAVQNLKTQGLPQALTGPISRADLAAVQQHVQAMQESQSPYLPLYVALAEATVPIAQQQDNTDSHRSASLQEILRFLRAAPF